MTASIATPTRAQAALDGLFLGDALAMPVHWYYDRQALAEDYGQVTEMLAPKEPHRSSIIWRLSYTPPSPENDIVHDQVQYWGLKGIHYHRSLAAGENTLTAQLARVLMESLAAHNGYDADDYLARYVDFLTSPGRHRDTYVEECHRGFFENRARGVALNKCAIPEKHIGGLVGLIPIVLWHRDEPDRAVAAAREHVALTHAGDTMARGVTLLADILLATLQGEGLRQVLDDRIARQIDPFLGHPFSKWNEQADAKVIGGHVSSACYLEDAVPAVLHLARKYHDDPEAALIANTNVGGDNVHRGALLGALLGAEHGPDAWPERWTQVLHVNTPHLQ